MENFIFYNPTKIIFGKNTISRISGEIKNYGKKVLLVYGKNSIKKNGTYQKITENLKKHNLEYIEHSNVKPNPVLSHVNEGIKKAIENKCDVILACGGGSVIDESKAIALGMNYNGNVWDFFISNQKVEKTTPLLTILTIPATGSEMNSGFVITNEETKQKYSARTPFSFPKVSILDPEITFSLPKEQTAYGISDMISHLLEGYLTNKDSDSILTDNYVLSLFKSIKEASLIILKDPLDYKGRSTIMWSSSLALNGLQSLGYKKISFPNHAIEHSLSAIYDIPHGLGLAIILPSYMRKNIKNIKEKIERINFEVFNIKEKLNDPVKPYENFLKSLGLETKLSNLNINEKDIPNIVDNVMGLITLWQIELTREEVTEILKLSF